MDKAAERLACVYVPILNKYYLYLKGQAHYKSYNNQLLILCDGIGVGGGACVTDVGGTCNY